MKHRDGARSVTDAQTLASYYEVKKGVARPACPKELANSTARFDIRIPFPACLPKRNDRVVRKRNLSDEATILRNPYLKIVFWVGEHFVCFLFWVLPYHYNAPQLQDDSL